MYLVKILELHKFLNYEYILIVNFIGYSPCVWKSRNVNSKSVASSRENKTGSVFFVTNSSTLYNIQYTVNLFNLAAI